MALPDRLQPWQSVARLVLPAWIGNWSLTSLQQRLVKTGARLIKHARYYWLLLAESHLTRRWSPVCCGKLRRCRCRRDSGIVGSRTKSP